MDPALRRQGSRYVVLPQDVERFRSHGWVHLEGVLGEHELAAIARDYDRFLRREIVVPGKDFCDMSGDYERPVDEFAIVNVMLPRTYHSAWRGNLYEQRAASIAEQLHGSGMAIDFDQLLAKRPFKQEAVFHWHQDQAYWPPSPDTRTATVWLAVDRSTRDNGCMRFVDGSHRERELRPHRPLTGDRESSHTLLCDVDEAREPIALAELAQGDVTVHGERVIHGSGGNRTAGWRRAYIVAFRAAETIALERRLGFTHSHNDAADLLREIGESSSA